MNDDVIEKIAQNICQCCHYQHEDCPFPNEKPCHVAITFAKQSLAELESLGFRWLAKNQKPPENPHLDYGGIENPLRTTYSEAQQDMLTLVNGEVWAKIKEVKG